MERYKTKIFTITDQFIDFLKFCQIYHIIDNVVFANL